MGKYKLKTSKTFAKRLKVYKSGKVRRRRACKGHILTKKSANRKRRLRKKTLLSGPDTKLVRRLMPYG